jgi:uncharacterized membrane protein YbhN (UPF0104 family)
LWSENLAIRGFGTASLIGEIACVLAALVLVPALLAKRRARGRWWAILPSLAIGGGLVLALAGGTGVRGHVVLASLRQLGFGAAALAAGFVMVQILLLATRLWFLAPGRPSWGRVTYGFALGQLLNNVVRRSGDVAKVLLIADPTRPELGRAEVAGLLVIDKAVDLAVLGALLAAVGLGQLDPFGGATWWHATLGGIVVAAIVAAVLLRRRSPLVARVFAGMRAGRDPVKLAGAAALALASWSAEICALRLLAGALGYEVGFADGVRTLVMLNLGIAVPLSAANIGTFEAAIAIGLVAAGLCLEDAVAIGAAYHLVQILAITVWAATGAITRRLLAPRVEPEAS